MFISANLIVRTLLQISMGLTLLLSSQTQAATDYPLVMQQLIARGDAAAQAYSPDQSIEFGNRFSGLYFGGFESAGLEFAVGQADQDAMLQIEMFFSRLINSAVQGQPRAEVQDNWAQLRHLLHTAPMLESTNASFWEMLVQSLLILLREGIEALLVIAALVAYLRKAGAADRVKYIWLGSAAALLASVVTAWVLQGFIANSGAAREALEGVTMLVAAVLLSYVSAWLFARREMQQWQGFVHNKLGSAIDGGSLSAIVSVAFFAVYREGAETILFYQALAADAEGHFDAIMAGMGLAAVALLAVYILIFQLSVRLPLKQFFTGTSGLLYALSVIFAGKAMLELQVAGWISTSWLEGFPTISWLGLFPSVEAIVAQVFMAALPLVVWLLLHRRPNKAAPNPA